MKKIVVLFSGGQDSATCLHLALKEVPAKDITALSFYYGQQHRVETDASEKMCTQLRIARDELDLCDALSFSRSGLIDGNLDKDVKSEIQPTLPNSFVPGRNALFLTVAHSFAQNIGATEIWCGANQVDYSGYPDCRPEFLCALQNALNIGSGSAIKIVAPLLYLSKAKIWRLAYDGGFLTKIIDNTVTCYRGDGQINVWGMGCGECNSCIVRKEGYEKFIDQLQKERK